VYFGEGRGCFGERLEVVIPADSTKRLPAKLEFYQITGKHRAPDVVKPKVKPIFNLCKKCL